MSPLCDRRAFLRRLGVAGVAAHTLPLVGCAPDRDDRSTDDAEVAPLATDSGPISIDRPVLLAWGGDGVHLAAPMAELPMAYVSMARREVFVDYESRGLSKWLLDAHISVSTGVWRIPLPGDPPNQPITPGDGVREFEELDIAAWDPSMEPAEGDFRIRRGRPTPLRIEFTCVPLAETGAWYTGGPWEVLRCAAGGEEACREDFLEIGTGVRHPRRACAEPGVPVRFLSWVGGG